ncbi:hypothetical protein ABFX02_04G163900 [Erythranthe guttata]
METALLCASSPFVYSHHYDKVGVSGSQSSHNLLSGKFMYRFSLSTRNSGIAPRRRAVVSSALGKGVKKRTIIPEPDYRIPIVLLGMSGGFVYTDNLAAAAPFGLLGLLLLVQATRVRFVFDENFLEVKVGDELQDSGENAFVGGKNRWKYSTFVNWELWWPSFPILVYFKETQTKPEGQIHFFPVIFNGEQLYNAMKEKCGPSKTSVPK